MSAKCDTGIYRVKSQLCVFSTQCLCPPTAGYRKAGNVARQSTPILLAVCDGCTRGSKSLVCFLTFLPSIQHSGDPQARKELALLLNDAHPSCPYPSQTCNKEASSSSTDVLLSLLVALKVLSLLLARIWVIVGALLQAPEVIVTGCTCKQPQ